MSKVDKTWKTRLGDVRLGQPEPGRRCKWSSMAPWTWASIGAIRYGPEVVGEEYGPEMREGLWAEVATSDLLS